MSETALLSKAQLADYERQGYVVVEDVFTAAEVEAMRRAFERLAATARTLTQTAMVDGAQFVVDPGAPDLAVEPVAIKRVVWCGAAEPVLSEFGRDPRLVDVAGQLMGAAEMEQLINQAHFKFPGDGVDFQWHQDSVHRRYGTDLWTDLDGRGSFIETAVAVDAMRSDNGPLEFIPGSHTRGHIWPDEHTGELPAASVCADDAVQLTMKPGSVVFFGPYVIHGSRPNKSDAPRRLFLNGFALPGANRRVYPGEGAGRLVRTTRRP